LGEKIFALGTGSDWRFSYNNPTAGGSAGTEPVRPIGEVREDFCMRIFPGQAANASVGFLPYPVTEGGAHFRA
jgi:hypothetical protein